MHNTDSSPILQLEIVRTSYNLRRVLRQLRHGASEPVCLVKCLGRMLTGEAEGSWTRDGYLYAFEPEGT